MHHFVVKGVTLKSYQDHYLRFIRAQIDRNEPFAITNPSQADRQLADYSNRLFEDAEGTPRATGRSHCVKVRAAVMLYHPELKHLLPVSGRALKGWTKLVPSQSHIPCPRALALAITAHMWEHGHRQAAVLTLLCFDALLRISEATGLRCRDVIIPDHYSATQSTIVILAETKRGRNESVAIKDGTVAHLIQVLARPPNDPSDKLFPHLTPRSYNATILSTLRALGVSFTMTAHSLRHGGASHAFLMGMPMLDIIQRGRWADPKTATRYIQEGKSLMLGAALPPTVRLLAHHHQTLQPWTCVSSLLTTQGSNLTPPLNSYPT